MKRVFAVTILGLGLSGCAGAGLDPADGAATGDASRPVPRPAVLAPPPPANAITAEGFDTTSSAERKAAKAVPEPGGERALGTSIATLGNPATPGFWLETPLVDKAGPGRVISVANGESVLVELIPIEADAGAGSRISLAALRLLGIGLTGLHELQVFAR